VSRHKDVVQQVSNGLEDLSISRPSTRLSWGIPVPDDDTQTIYVWLDALINYITKAGYPWTPGSETVGGWPADVQVIGKDIVRFHCIYWPAFLLALDLQPPKQILTHAHWTMDNQKMSKSIGNVVDPFFALDRWGLDTMRYYLIHEGRLGNDSDYGNRHIVEKYKKDLKGGLGNLVSRVTRPKIWNIKSCLERARGNDMVRPDESSQEMFELLTSLREGVSNYMDKLRSNDALMTIMNAVSEVRYFDLVFFAHQGTDSSPRRINTYRIRSRGNSPNPVHLQMKLHW
jgi:methionyl-tRNA synthetase